MTTPKTKTTTFVTSCCYSTNVGTAVSLSISLPARRFSPCFRYFPRPYLDLMQARTSCQGFFKVLCRQWFVRRGQADNICTYGRLMVDNERLSDAWQPACEKVVSTLLQDVAEVRPNASANHLVHGALVLQSSGSATEAANPAEDETQSAVSLCASSVRISRWRMVSSSATRYGYESTDAVPRTERTQGWLTAKVPKSLSR